MTSSGGPPPPNPQRPGLPAAGQRRRLVMAGPCGQVSHGRDFTRQALLDWQWLTDRTPSRQESIDEVLLLVSELLANASLHAGGPRELILHATPTVLRIEVFDGDPGVPQPRPHHHPALPGGHGLRIVEHLSDRWGVTTREAGKTVWVEVATTRFDSVTDIGSGHQK
ncbi:ATP-binding protein [Streptomyces sp. A1136]|uniref:ATP-binding protein n=1 Tax=Streptomyces sp. A1136 TaxID=2563102 RepID=UPI001F0F4C3E|nr:ATP-binding protein [Streptomyces sp. A1136]